MRRQLDLRTKLDLLLAEDAATSPFDALDRLYDELSAAKQRLTTLENQINQQLQQLGINLAFLVRKRLPHLDLSLQGANLFVSDGRLSLICDPDTAIARWNLKSGSKVLDAGLSEGEVVERLAKHFSQYGVREDKVGGCGRLLLDGRKISILELLDLKV